MSGLDEQVDSVLRLPALWQHQGTEHINAIRWAHDDSRLAVAYADGSLAVFNTATGTCLWHEQAHGIDTSAIEWSPDDRLLASAGQSGGLKLWDSQQGDLLHQLDCGKGWAQQLSWARDGLLACACGKAITLWTEDGALIQTLEANPSTVTGLHWLPDGRLFSSCYGMVTQWAANQTLPQDFFHWKDSLSNVLVSPDERFVVAACQDSAVHLWYLSSGEDLQMSGYPSKIKSMHWSYDSRYFATASGQLVVVWNCEGKGPQGTEPKIVPVHQKPVTTLAFAHGNHHLASASQEGLVFVFDIARDEPVAGLHNDTSVSALAWNHSDTLIAIGDGHGLLQICPVPQ